MKGGGKHVPTLSALFFFVKWQHDCSYGGVCLPALTTRCCTAWRGVGIRNEVMSGMCFFESLQVHLCSGA